MNQAGFVVIAMAGLWIAYLVPHRLRYRQQLLESRTEDRFSEQLRVLRVAEDPARGNGRLRLRRATTVEPAVDAPGRVHLHSPRDQVGRAGRGGGPMDRPHGTRDRISADAARRSAAEHARRAAHLQARAAGARRRALLTAVLLLAVAAGWTVVGVSGASVLAGAVPSVALLGVLGLGRRAVVAGARADAEWEAGAATRVPLPVARAARGSSVVGRAVHPSEGATEIMARVPSAARPSARATSDAVGAGVSGPADAEKPAATPSTVSAGSAASADRVVRTTSPTWAPVPVPRPTYTLKPAARRGEPAPLVLDEPQRAVSPDELSAPVGADGVERADELVAPAAAASRTSAGLDLDAILARRRAAGE